MTETNRLRIRVAPEVKLVAEALHGDDLSERFGFWIMGTALISGEDRPRKLAEAYQTLRLVETEIKALSSEAWDQIDKIKEIWKGWGRNSVKAAYKGGAIEKTPEVSWALCLDGAHRFEGRKKALNRGKWLKGLGINADQAEAWWREGWDSEEPRFKTCPLTSPENQQKCSLVGAYHPGQHKATWFPEGGGVQTETWEVKI